MAGLAAPWMYFAAQRVVDMRTPLRVGHGVTTRSIPTSTRAPWMEGGFVEMVPPLRLPSRVDGSEKIEVWLKLPPTGSLGVKWIEGQARHALTYPPGTVADRIEMLDGVHIVDVRGTELGERGAESFHVYRGHGEDGLLEVMWPRDDAAAQAEATRALVAHEIAEGRSQVQSVKINNACGPCHAHAREERLAGVPARRTDAAGWFVPETVLLDRVPVEHHRPREMNVDDPFVRFVCPSASGEAPAEVVRHDDGTRWPVCAGKVAAVGVLDLPAALAANDAHARQVCDSRRALFSRMDDEARRAYASAFEACSIR
jgi:hypothetical protein